MSCKKASLSIGIFSSNNILKKQLPKLQLKKTKGNAKTS